MSTPTTATATLPHYAAGYPFAHQTSYRPTLPAPSTSRLGPSSVSSPSSSSYAPYSPSSAHLVPAAASSRPPHQQQQQHYHPAHSQTHGHSQTHHNTHAYAGHLDATVSSPSFSTTTTITLPPTRLSHGTITSAGTPSAPIIVDTASAASVASTTSAMASQTHSANDSQPPRKRRRSGPPDWETFYKNGLPQEVILIEDSPERDVTHAQLRTDTAAYTAHAVGNSHAHAANAAVGGPDMAAAAYHYEHKDQNGMERHIAKKRRRQDEPLPPAAAAAAATLPTAASSSSSSSGGNRYDPVHNYLQHSSASTISSERTQSNSALYAAFEKASTAAVSLVSAVTQQYEYENAGQKRKRTTRQAANESKKREHDASAVRTRVPVYRTPPLPPVKASEVDVKVVHDPHYSKSIKVDDDDGHYIVVPDAELTKRYQMIKLLGQGTFGKVVQARDRERNEYVAIKIIRSVQKYRDASRIELRVLETLKANDRDNRNRCIHLRECFDYRGHICIVTDLLGQSVFDFLKGNSFVPFPNSQIQNFARQLFTSVAFLHDLHLIHTDLKPENILLVDSTYQTFTYNRKIPSSSTTVSRTSSQRRVLLDTEIRLIDFGSATFQEEYHSSVVSTRHYRAPEIILGLGWSYPCDIWSIGCILVEFYTGDALFQTHDNLEHLAMMEAVCDSRIDSHLVQAVTKNRHGSNPASKYFKRSRLDYPNDETTRASRRFVKAMKKLDDIFPSASSSFLRQFLDLLKRIFIYDPSRRITAKEALQHPWFREVAVQDDGTEAARIRQQRAHAASRERAATRVSQLRS